MIQRSEIAKKITGRLFRDKQALVEEFRRPGRIPRFVVDDLLDEKWAGEIYAFQDPQVIGMIFEITGMRGLLPDENLDAGGISLMARGNFLYPHLDNSHDNERKNYRGRPEEKLRDFILRCDNAARNGLRIFF